MRKSHKCIILLSLLLANIVVIAQVPTNGLIGYWPFNGNANDVSGNGNNGILEGEGQNPQLTTDRFGNTNSAYQFGGYYNKNWIRVPNNSTMHLNNQMTVSFWFQQCEFSGMDGWGNYSTSSASFSLVTKAGDGIAAYPGFWINSSINAQTGNLNISSVNKNVAGYYETNYEVPVQYNCFDTCEWMHYVTAIEDNVARIYINGVLYRDTIIDHASYAQANVQDLYFGRMGCNGTIWYPFHGKLDDVAFYNRALTEAEVAQLFDNYYDPHYFDNQIVIEDLIVQKACDGNNGGVQVFPNMENGPFQYALDQPTNFQNSNLLNNISEGLHRVYVKSECGLKDTIVDFSCLDIPFPDNVMDIDCTSPANPNSFEMVELFAYPNVNSMSTPMVADMDGDGLPEIIVCSYTGSAPWYSTGFYVVNGQTGELKYDISTVQYRNAGQMMTIADVDNDGKAELFLMGRDMKIYCYNYNGGVRWSSANTVDNDYLLSATDVNNDGEAEIVCGKYIYNAQTGALLLEGTMVETGMGFGAPHSVDSYHPPYYMYALGDVDGDGTPELCAGNTVYKIQIVNPSGTMGNSWSILRQANLPDSIINKDGETFIVDFDNDGDFDICVIGVTHSLNNYTSSHTIDIYVWDGQTSQLIAHSPLLVNSEWGASIPYSGDLNGDGFPEIIFAVTDIGMLAYTYETTMSSMSMMHNHAPFGETSGFTVFDFNQDGRNEIVYRGTHQLFIVDGVTLNNLSEPITAYSGTVTEYPVVADVNADGHAEIIVTRAYDDWFTSSNANGWVSVYGSQIPGAWSSARKVWNQWAYNSVNINEDLTVPRYIFDISTVFPNGEKPFNTFLHQMPYIDTQGNLFNAAADAAAISADVTISGGEATFTLTYTNQGDNTLNAPYYITVFANEMGGAMLQSFTVNEPLLEGNTVQQSLSFSSSALCQMPDLNSIVVAINCAGGGIAQDGNLQPECDIDNNVAELTLNLQSEPTQVSVTACGPYEWYGQTYTQSGQYETSIPNAYGCDSTLILTLTISDVEVIELPSVTECDTYGWHGQTYTESGTYTYDTLNAFGCPMQYILPLTIGHSTEYEFSVTSCEPYEWYGTVYDEPGTYTQLLTGSQGCDSLVSLNLVVGLGLESSIHGPTTIYPSTDLVSGVYSYYIDSTGIDLSNVRWGIDREDWQLIPHGASCDLLCMSDGEGILHVWTEGEFCNMDTTIVVNAMFFGMGEAESSLRVYPNPTKGKLTVEWEEIQVINVYDLLGQKLMSREYGKEQVCVLDLSHFRHSMYVLEVVSSGGRVKRPVMLTQ